MQLLVVCLLALVGGLAQEPDQPKGAIVKIDEMESRAPADWKAEKPANRLRSHQFRLPRAKDDKEDAELSILPNITGAAEKNIQRWKEMFNPPEDKTLEEVSRVETLKIGPAKAIYLDVAGTYLHKDRPFDPTSKTTPRPGYRMFSIMFETPDGAHLIRLVGPARTMAQHKNAFDAWLKDFKKP